MASFGTCQAFVLGALLLTAPAFASRTHRAATSGHTHHKLLHHHATTVRGQRQIDPDRAREIQTALIHEHYLSAPASGEWDSTTEAAMQKFQADHGWQTKLTPDSRALIKLGLGPKTDASQAVASTPGFSSMLSNTDASPSTASAGANTLADAHQN